MAFFDSGNPPIPSTGFTPVAAPSTSTLLAELDSTMLGTKNLAAGQKLIVVATYVLGADTNVTWQCGTCNSTALNAGQDEFYPKTPTGQSGQYVVKHELFTNYRIRARLFSTGANAAAYISAEIQT
jgi:hypothetical protein